MPMSADGTSFAERRVVVFFNLDSFRVEIFYFKLDLELINPQHVLC